MIVDLTKETRLRLVRELRASEAWQKVMAPELERRKKFHSEALRDRNLSAEKRAEHVEASHMADELLGYLDAQERVLITALKRE